MKFIPLGILNISMHRTHSLFVIKHTGEKNTANLRLG